MSEPVRLRDDPDVPSALRSDLTSAAATAPRYDVTRGLGRLSAAIAASGGAPGGGTPGGGGAGPAGPTGGPSHPPLGAGAAAKTTGILKGAAWLKAGVWAYAGLGVVTAIGVSTALHFAPGPITVGTPHSPSGSRDPATAEALASARRTPAPTDMDRDRTTTDRADVSAPKGAPPAEAAPTAAARTSDATDSKRPLGSAAAASTGAPSPSPLAEEMAALAEARTLVSSNPSRALALADDGQRRFPGGVFAQEREAIAIRALAALGRQREARARADAFIASQPNSPFAEQVRRATQPAP